MLLLHMRMRIIFLPCARCGHGQWHPPVHLGDTGCLRVRVSSVEHCIVQRVAAVELLLWRQLVHAVKAANASPCG
jgi:hypothetical protein